MTKADHCKLVFLPDNIKSNVVAVLQHLFVYAQKILELPAQIEVQLMPLPGGEYARSHLSYRFRNRIVLNSDLSEREIMLPFIHELIHQQQAHQGWLSTLPSGTVVWKRQHYPYDPHCTWEQYINLPWEIDAFSQHGTVLKKCLELARQP